ncbi:MAG: hypothetical protein IT201_08530 [Thermoleophilia bacterium]|nr:hypothetical protein [Thermoleophilia bacterium]
MPASQQMAWELLPALGAAEVSSVPGATGPWPASAGVLVEAIRPPGATEPAALAIRKPRSAGSPSRLDAVLVRREADAGGSAVLHQALTLVDAAGETVGEGRVSWWTDSTLPAAVAEAWRRCDVGTATWGRALGARLEERPGFADMTRSFDGTIGLGAEDREVQLRIYRGRVLEAVPKTLEGATFSVAGSDLAWTRFLLSGRDDFVRRTSAGEFNARGSSFQYLRMFKTVATMVVEARRMWEEETRALGQVP